MLNIIRTCGRIRPALSCLLLFTALLPVTGNAQSLVLDHFPNASYLGDDRFESPWFGTFDATSWPWLDHETHGWLYAEQDAGKYWFYEPQTGWIYTNESVYSFFYSYENKGWFYRYSQEGGVDWAYFYEADDWFMMDDSFDPLTVDVVEAVRFAEIQAAATAEEISTYSQYTHGIVNGHWDSTSAAGWTSGLLPGVYWMLYHLTGNTEWFHEAEMRTAPIESQKNNTGTHDLHFMVGIPFLAGYELTGNEHYRDVVVTTAASLATRYMPEVGTIDSWGWGNYANERDTIIDNMINIELLLWGSEQPGGDPEWLDMAISHADKTAEHFICDDGSTTHVITWNADGTVKSRQRDCTLFPNDEIFARGTGWAIYGYAMTYRYTEMDKYTDTFDKLVQFFFREAPDGIPYWSFAQQGVSPNVNLDSSASALALGGLFEMSQLHPDAVKRAEYWDKATSLLATLVSPDFLGDGPGNGILYHATNGITTRTDTALIYGDYYLLVAIKRYLDIVGYSLH